MFLVDIGIFHGSEDLAILSSGAMELDQWILREQPAHCCIEGHQDELIGEDERRGMLALNGKVTSVCGMGLGPCASKKRCICLAFQVVEVTFELMGPLRVPVLEHICRDLLIDVDKALVECRSLKT